MIATQPSFGSLDSLSHDDEIHHHVPFEAPRHHSHAPPSHAFSHGQTILEGQRGVSPLQGLQFRTISPTQRQPSPHSPMPTDAAGLSTELRGVLNGSVVD